MPQAAESIQIQMQPSLPANSGIMMHECAPSVFQYLQKHLFTHAYFITLLSIITS
jgi:hypothetical protein